MPAVLASQTTDVAILVGVSCIGLVLVGALVALFQRLSTVTAKLGGAEIQLTAINRAVNHDPETTLVDRARLLDTKVDALTVRIDELDTRGTTERNEQTRRLDELIEYLAARDPNARTRSTDSGGITP